MRYRLFEMIISAFAAMVAVQVAFGEGHPRHGMFLAQASGTPPATDINPAVAAWTMAILIDMLILGAIGLAGGFLSLIAIPFRSTNDAIIRVICGGVFSSLFAGALIIWAGMGSSHPSIRMAVAGLSGFFSYPALMWIGQNGLTWALKRLGVEATMNSTNTTTTTPAPAISPKTE